jgi:hypothetical protein
MLTSDVLAEGNHTTMLYNECRPKANRKDREKKIMAADQPPSWF